MQRSFLFFLLWTNALLILMAQTAGTGAMAGMVSDPSGLAIAGVNVTATSMGTGISRTTSTGSDGDYTFTMLPPGTYRVRFSAAGFRTAEIVSVTVDVNNTPDVKIQMQIGTQNEEVVFQWEAQAAQTATSTSGNLADEHEVTSLPLSSRNYTQILGLSAGVSSEVNNASAIGTGAQTVQAAGSRASGFSMDGASSANTSATASTPNPDAIQQFSVQTSQYDAGSGRSSGATVNVVTKSGTNSFHGTFFEFVRNDIFNANEFFRKRNNLPRPVLKQNQFGFTFGGPIMKDRLFFFGSYQGTRQRNGFASAGFASNVLLPPLPENRTAAMLGNAFCPENHPGDKRYQTFFGGVQIACDGSNVNPVALNILNLRLPGSSYYVLGSGTGTFQTTPFSIPAKYNEDQILLNVDYVISSKHTFAERLFYSDAPQLSNFSGSNSMPGAPSETSNENLNIQLKLTSVLGANFVNEARMSGQRTITISTPLIPFTNEDIGVHSLVPTLNKLDGMSISGLFSIGASQSWDTSSNNRYIWADQISWVHGKQTIRAGLEIERAQWNALRAGWSIGKITFMSFNDFLLGLPGCPPSSATCNTTNPIVNGVRTNGSAFSNVLAADGVVTEPGGIYHAYRLTNYVSFVQDDIKLTPRLTLNLGTRWEYNGLPYDINGDHTTIWLSMIRKEPVPAPEGTYAGFVVPSNFRRELAPGVYRNHLNIPTAERPSMKNFSPRFGFAWQPFGGSRFSMRGGYGLFYDRANDTSVISLTVRSVPYATPLGASGAANYFSSFAQPFLPAVLGWGSPRKVNFATGESSNLSLRLIQEDFGTPQTRKWNLNIQYEFLPKWSLELGYEGSNAIRLLQVGHSLNGAWLATTSYPVNGVTTSTVQNASLRVPYLGIAPKGIDMQETKGESNYNSLQATLQKRLSQNMQFQMAYTFSKTMVYSINSNDPTDKSQQYGISTSARQQRLVINYTWELPHKGAGLFDKFLSDLSLSGVATVQSGMPITIIDNRGGTIYGSPGESRAQFCDGMGAVNVATSGNVKERLDKYFNVQAFCAPPAISDGTGYGNSGHGIIRGPGQANWDLSLSKSITIREVKLELRTEFFNAFNHAQFSNPDNNRSNPNFGRITSTSVNPRLIQFGFKLVF
jgi:hypothetical protein